LRYEPFGHCPGAGDGQIQANFHARAGGICGLSHRQSYADIFVVAVAIPVLALVVVVTLGSAFGSF
jgi:hypothetical protein